MKAMLEIKICQIAAMIAHAAPLISSVRPKNTKTYQMCFVEGRKGVRNALGIAITMLNRY